MRKTFFIILALLSASVSVHAETKIEIREFKGGFVDLSAKFYTDLFYGSRGDALRCGGANSTLDFQQSFTSYNPAGMAFQTKPYFSMSVFPAPIGASSDTIQGFAGDSVKKMINDQLKDALPKEMTATAGVSLAVEGARVYMGQDAALTGFEGYLPLADGGAGIGLAREEKSNLQIGLLLQGMEALVKVTDPANSLLSMDMRAKINLAASMGMRNIVTSFGLARKITPLWGAGIVLERYESSLYARAAGAIDGIATLAGNTVEFNTNSGNSLDQSLNADLKAEGWGVRIGTAAQFYKETLETAIDFSFQPELEYSGALEGTTHSLPSTIDIADFTKTKEEKLKDPGKIRVKLPSYMRVAFAWKPSLNLIVNYTHYFDGYSLRTNDMEANFTLMDDFRIGFNFGAFQLGGGAVLTRLWTKQKKDGVMTEENLAWFAQPVFSTGFVVSIGQNIKTEVAIWAVPLPLFKTAITYVF